MRLPPGRGAAGFACGSAADSDRAAHAEHGRVVDVEPVDLPDIDEHDLPGERALDDARVEFLAAFRRELLGIGQAVDRRPARGEYHGRHHHGAGQRTASGLVDAGDAQHPVVAGRQGVGGHGRRVSWGWRRAQLASPRPIHASRFRAGSS